MALLSAAVPVEPRGGADGRADPRPARRHRRPQRRGAGDQHRDRLALRPAGARWSTRAARRTALARIFPDLDAGELYAQFTDGRKFLWVKRTISPEQRQLVHDLGEPGAAVRPARGAALSERRGGGARARRRRASGARACDAAEVVGTAGRRAGVRRAAARSRRAPASRCGCRSTSRCRRRSRRCWRQGMAEMNAKGAVGILMEADTGQIRRWRACRTSTRTSGRRCRPGATRPTARSSTARRRGATSSARRSSCSRWRRRSRRGWSTPQTLIDTKGPMRWGRFTIRDFHDYGPRLTVEDVLVKSSNIGAARIGMMIGAERQRAFLGRIGLLDADAGRAGRGGGARRRCCRRAGPTSPP